MPIRGGNATTVATIKELLAQITDLAKRQELAGLNPQTTGNVDRDTKNQHTYRALLESTLEKQRLLDLYSDPRHPINYHVYVTGFGTRDR